MSTSHQMSHELLEQFLDSERDDTRQWIRCEMLDLLVDPLVDCLFDKLKNRFGFFLQKQQQNHHDPESSIDHHHHHEPLKCDHQTPSSSSTLSTNTTSNHNHLPNGPLIRVKEEILDDDDEDDDSLEMNENIRKHSEIIHEDDDEDCDCEECLNGGLMDVKMEQQQNDDQVDDDQLVHDDQLDHQHPNDQHPNDQHPNDQHPNDQHPKDHQYPNDQHPDNHQQPENDPEVSRPLKQLRMMNLEYRNPNKDPTFTIHKLKCHEPLCPELFDNKDQLNIHMWDRHRTRRCRCSLKHCSQSFDNSTLLGNHIRDAHCYITEWSCQQCAKSYKSYHVLYQHTMTYHHMGQFACTYPTCGHISDHRGRAAQHFKQTHQNPNNSAQLVCQFTGCTQRFSTAQNLRAHERTHLHVLPFRCRWPDCGFAGPTLDLTMRHIRQLHFHVSRSNREAGVVVHGDPDDYLEVV